MLQPWYKIGNNLLCMPEFQPFFISLLTAALVVELLEYCDEYEEESQDGSSDTEMGEGEKNAESKKQP